MPGFIYWKPEDKCGYIFKEKRGRNKKRVLTPEPYSKLNSSGEVVVLTDEECRMWVKAYHQFGESGLARKGTSNGMKKKRQRTEAELDELEMLRKRNEYLEAENALLKKVKALVEEREARLRAIGQKPSKD